MPLLSRGIPTVFLSENISEIELERPLQAAFVAVRKQ